MFQMQMMVLLSRRTALGFWMGLWTDSTVCVWTWEKCTRLMGRPVGGVGRGDEGWEVGVGWGVLKARSSNWLNQIVVG